MGNALRPQVGLALPELLYDLVAIHDALCSTKGPDFTAEPGATKPETILPLKSSFRSMGF
jgi:hypothetical protein